MSYDNLPIELRIMILAQIHNIYEENARLIQQYWYKFINPQKVAIKLLKDFANNLIDFHNSMVPETGRIITYSAKVLTSKGSPKKINFCISIIKLLQLCLWFNEYSDGPQAYVYNKIEKGLHILAKKFDISLDYNIL